MGYTMAEFCKDVKDTMERVEDNKEDDAEVEKLYRVRKTWADAKSQKGAYKVLKSAEACADKNVGYLVFEWNGNVVYAPSKVSEPEQKRCLTVCESALRT